MAEHSLSADPTHSRWNRRLSPRLSVAPGDTVHLACHDASGAQVRPGMTLAEYLAIDRDRIHALTGPIFVEGAEAGDTLEIEVLEVAHKGWGWSSVISGLGFLKERFREPYLFHWELDGASSRSLAPAIVPLRPFCARRRRGVHQWHRMPGRRHAALSPSQTAALARTVHGIARSAGAGLAGRRVGRR